MQHPVLERLLPGQSQRRAMRAVLEQLRPRPQHDRVDQQVSPSVATGRAASRSYIGPPREHVTRHPTPIVPRYGER